MCVQPRELLLLVTLAAAMPAWGQTVVPAVGTVNSGTQGAVPIWHMGPPILARLRAAVSGTRPSDE
jgi:hypothetical protein